MKKILNKIKGLAPWVMAAVIFWYLFRSYPPQRVAFALSHVNLVAFIAFSFGYFIFVYSMDALVMQKFITKFSHPVTFKDIFIARGVSYLIMIINYPASQAAFAFYLKKKYNIAIFKALGIFMFIMFIDLLWIITIAFVGSFFQNIVIADINLSHTVKIVALCGYSFAVLWVAFWRGLPEKLIGHKINLSFLKKIKSRKIFHIFNTAKISDYFKLALMRSPIHLTIIFFMYVVMITFNAHVPFMKVIAIVPVVFLIGTLPITPGGLGTTNFVMVELLAPFVTGVAITSLMDAKELLFAATLLWMFVNYSYKAIIGTILLKFAAKDLFRAPNEKEEEAVEKEIPSLHENI